MSPHEYLGELKASLIALSCIASLAVVEERTLPDRGYFRARMVLTNGDFLEVAEYFVFEEGDCRTKRYRYQWMDSSRQRLKKRWDNVEHHPELPNFPHHIHVGEDTNVEPRRALSIIEVMELIEEEIDT